MATINVTVSGYRSFAIHTDRETYTRLRIAAFLRALENGTVAKADADLSEELQAQVIAADRRVAESDARIAEVQSNAYRDMQRLQQDNREVQANAQREMQRLQAENREVQALRAEVQRLTVLANMLITIADGYAAEYRQRDWRASRLDGRIGD